MEMQENMFTKTETLKAKCLAVLLILFHHMFSSPEGTAEKINTHILPLRVLNTLAIDARFCVWIFAFLSAYGMTVAYNKFVGGNNRYFLHRCLTLYSFCLPILAIHYVLNIIFKNPVGMIYKPIYIIFNILGISDWVSYPALGDVYWYISFTLVLIIFFPFLYRVCDIYQYIVFFMGIIILHGYINLGIHSDVGGYYVQYLFAILMGIIFAQKGIWNKIYTFNQRKYSKKFLFVVTTLCMLVLPYIRNTYIQSDVLQVKQILMTFAALAGCSFTFICCRWKWLNIVMTFVGKHSANIFLIHPLVLRYLGNVIYYTKNVLVSYVTCAGISILLSMVLEQILEKTGYNALIKKIDNYICKK